MISCISCEYYGVVDAKLTPFFKLVAATFARWRPTATGGYEGATYEIEYFIDSATSDVLGAWRNPYTGELVTANHTDSVPAKFVINADGSLDIPPELIAPGAVVVQDRRSFQVIGNDVWRMERSTATVPNAGAKPLHFDETVTWHAKVSDLLASDRMQVRTDTQYLGISSFRAWQKMGDHPGEMIGVGRGVGGVEITELPPTWLAATAIHHPGFLSDPKASLESVWKAL